MIIPFQITSLPSSRHGAEVIELSPDEHWILGGNGNGESYTATTLIYSNEVFSPGPDMPYGAKGHCMAKVNDELIVLTGGITTGISTNQAYLYHVPSGEWEEISSMSQTREDHGCGIAR